jgi:RNA-directed DNA polymerase
MNSVTGSATCTLPHREQLGVMTIDLWQVYGQWKTPRRHRAALLELGVRPRLVSNTAGSRLGPWYLAGPKPSVGLSNARFISLGLPALIDGC